MQRLIVTGPCAATFEDVPLPECAPDGIVVRARLTAVSTGTEIRVFRAIPVDAAGRFLHERKPFVLPTENGYSMVGEVVEVGRDVTGFAVGERVFAPMPHKQFAALPAQLAVRLPAEIPDEQAVFLNILEVGHLALRRGNPTIGDCAAIVGQGVIGLGALGYCRAYGLRTAVVDKQTQRLDIARRMQAELAVSPAEEGFVERVIEHFDGRGADVVIEAGSTWSAIRTSMDLARTDGKVVIASRHTQMPDFNPFGHPYLGKRLNLLTSYGYDADGQRWDRRRSIARTLDLLASRQLLIEPMITHRFSWNELPQVYARLHQEDRELVGVVIRW